MLLSMFELLTPEQMTRADQLAIKAGTPGITLMENAGHQVVRVIQKSFPETNRILVVCGTGNNGGDGFVAARLLREAGLEADTYIAGYTTSITGDAKLALAKLDKKNLLARLPDIGSYDLVIDALLGAGLDRDVDGKYAELIKLMNGAGKPIISVDLPSGIDGKTGVVRGVAIQASACVTFFRYKPGHILLPGRSHCGTLHLCQIGIHSDIVKSIEIEAVLNTQELWFGHYPQLNLTGHKYSRGHTLAISGDLTNAGASRLMAGAALRAGSGLVTLASPTDALVANASQLTSIMLREANSINDIYDILSDQRFNCVALGPGLPPAENTCELVEAVLKQDRITVLDAGGLSCFEKQPQRLFSAIKAKQSVSVLTPHEGEFTRLFPYESCSPSKIERARQAAVSSGAIIVLKGPDTVVASPDGQASVSNNAPPWLATAGSGDVLAGIIAGLLAQRMPAFEAVNSAVWLHGEAANLLGQGMISSNLDTGLQLAIKTMFQ